MPSTYSNLKFELLASGEQTGTWGNTANTNIGTAIEEAIAGRASVVYTADTDLTLTLSNTNASQVARNYILSVTSTVPLTGTRNLIVPTINKPYIVENNTTGGQSLVVKTSTGTGLPVPNGKTVLLYVTESGSTIFVDANLRNFADTPVSSPQVVNALAATGTATDIGIALIPKGAGAFSLNVPNGALSGGNARGAYAVDLQLLRQTAATQVASGAASFVAGVNNTASGTASVAMGAGCTASELRAIAMGLSSSASAPDSVAIGSQNVVAAGSHFSGALGDLNNISIDRSWAIGEGNTVSTGGYASAIGVANNVTSMYGSALGSGLSISGFAASAMGRNNTSSGASSSVPGGALATTNSIQGLLAYGFNGAVLGQNQMSFFGARPSTTGTTAKRATADDAAASTTNQLTLRNNSAVRVFGQVIARDTVTNDCKEWSFNGLVKRGAAAANTALVGTPSITTAFADTAAASWTIALVADTTNGALGVNVTGAGTNVIRWTVVIRSTEVG